MASRTAGKRPGKAGNLRDADGAQAPPELFLWTIIVVWTIAVFIADLYTTLGIAVWVFYAGPVVVAFALSRPAAPFVVAATAAVLVIVGFHLSPAGVERWLSALNRSFGVFVVFTLAVAGWLFIRGKCALEREEWLQTRQVAIGERISGDQTIRQFAEACSFHAMFGRSIYRKRSMQRDAALDGRRVLIVEDDVSLRCSVHRRYAGGKREG